jgi:hypothetical protein
MTQAEARKRITALTSEVAANPARAVELAPEIAELGRTIQATPEKLNPKQPNGAMQVCVSHDKVCRGHQVCNSHPKALAEAGS